MNGLKNIIQRQMNISRILILAFMIKLSLYTFYPPFWDAASYILMGKYFFSSGTVGLLEPFRPPVWPLCLGLFWKIGLDPIATGKILEIILGLGNILLIYLIGKKVYDKNAGLLAALFVTFSPTFFIWGNSLYTDVPAIFFGLLTFYLFLEQRFFISGLMGSLAFFTKFTQIIPWIALTGTHLLFRPSKPGWTEIAKSFFGFCLITSLFLMFNHYFYGNYFTPFQEAREVYLQPTTSSTTAIFKCVKLLIAEENWLLPLTLVSLIHLFKGSYRSTHWAVALAGLCSLAAAGKTATDYHRLSLTSLPYLYLLLAQGIGIIKQQLDKTMSIRIRQLFMTVLVIVFAVQLNTVVHMRFPKNEWSVFQKYIAAHKEDLKGNLWISSPKMLVFSNLKPQEQMYHPIFSHRKAQQLRSKLSGADIILFNSYDLPCVPKGDPQCEEGKTRLMEEIKRKFKSEFYEEDPNGLYMLGIFKKP